MKKIISTFGLCILLLTTSHIGYAKEQQVQLESKSPRAQSDQIIVFQDPILEQILKEQMGKQDGEITVADAQKITELRLNIEWGSPEEIRIRDISGLEYFTNLETLELLFHAIQDITPLANLTNLRVLSLGGNEIQDITPLSQLTNLEELTLFNCQASDYSPLRNLINLRGLMLEYSTISDLSPLANLTNLQRLSLSNPQITDITPLTNLINLTNLQVGESSIEDFSPIREIYPNLLEKDFEIDFSLSNLGFELQQNGSLAVYTNPNENIELLINHQEWGNPELPQQLNAITAIFDQVFDQNKLSITYYPQQNIYLLSIENNNNPISIYMYDGIHNLFGFVVGNEVDTLVFIDTYLSDIQSDQLLQIPIQFFNNKIESLFKVDLITLVGLDFERKTLNSLGFQDAIKQESSYIYDQNNELNQKIYIYKDQWGGKENGADLKITMTIRDGYDLSLWYYPQEQRYFIKIESSNGTSTDYEYVIKEDKFNDGMSPEGMSVEEYLKELYQDPSIDLYREPISIANKFIDKSFGLDIDQLLKLDPK